MHFINDNLCISNIVVPDDVDINDVKKKINLLTSKIKSLEQNILSNRNKIEHNKKINKQINDFSKLGIKNIIVCQNDKSKVMYNIKKFREYLEDNKGEILEYINDENNDKITYFSNNDDNIFYNKNILLTEFIKWCCDKKKSNGYMQ